MIGAILAEPTVAAFFADMPDYSRLLIRFVQSAFTEIERSRGTVEKAKVLEERERSPETPARVDIRRTMAGSVAFLLLAIAATAYLTNWLTDWTGSQSTSEFIVSAMTRIGLVIGAIWLAWDSMRRPAQWIPPGLAVAGVVGIIVVAAQPKLIFAIVPLLGGLAVFTSIIRAVRRR